MLTPAEGTAGLGLARAAVAARIGPAPPDDPAAVARGARLPPLFDEARGVFVTLRTRATGGLRGCVGYPRPVEALRWAIPHVAVAAAVDDPRFPPVAPAELGGLAVELSVLTVPERLVAETPAARAASIEVGRDGLVVVRDGAQGLLLPQVATEEGWDAATFLAATCVKAGLPRAAWRDPATAVYRFAADVVREPASKGAVSRGG